MLDDVIRNRTKNALLYLVLIIALGIRLATIWRYGLGLTLHSDDSGYTDSAVWLLQHGIYAYYTPKLPTLHMMPGITLLLAGVFGVFGTGSTGIYAAKVVMSIVGVLGIYGVYLVGQRIFSRPVGLVAALLATFYVPGIETDTLLMTESPFFLSSTFFLYFILRAGESHKGRDLYIATLFYVLGIYFRPTIAVYPILALIYLLIKKYPLRPLTKQAAVVIVLVVALLSPWWVRNAVTFHKFVPLTDGTGNPLLLGTFQGHGYPPPATADAELNKLLGEHPQMFPTKDHEVEWMTLQTQVAKQRLVDWIRTNPSSFVDSFVQVKMSDLWLRPYFPLHLFKISQSFMWNLQPKLVDAGLIGWAFALIFGRRRRVEVTLIWTTFAYYTVLYCVYFAYARYAEPLMPLMLMGIPAGIWGIWMFLVRFGRKQARGTSR